MTSPATWTCADEGVYVRVGVLLFLHQRHFVDDRVGVVQLIWNQEATQHDNMCTVVVVGKCVGVCVCARACACVLPRLILFSYFLRALSVGVDGRLLLDRFCLLA